MAGLVSQTAGQKATRDAYGEALVAVGRRDPRVVALTGDLRDSTRLEAFAAAFPDRFIECGIAEQNMVGVAAGLATCGKVPFVSSFAVFVPGRAYDQIRVLVAQPNLNVKLVSTHGGLTVGEDGMTAQAIEELAMMRALANMTVIVPADATETQQVIAALADHRGPAYVRLGRAAVPVLFDETYTFAIGRAARLRDGTDVTLIACGIMVAEALAAAETLAAEGIGARVLNMATLKPLDETAVLEAARETGAIVTAEEHTIYGGLGGAVAEVTSAHEPVPVERVGIRDVFGESGSPRALMEKYGLTAAEIAGAARRALTRKRRR
ncbi:MAG: transketolase C-terminal domain-containing protein [Armatimonadota bacterium]|nr:transketolase C-terminal domain-containing protein [Armatimonadota bacterium]MDR7533440.1 transketolase C-terminal domain-containing protein [Armatimonadota bacterium]MDR7536254.1 transketolase C-terminal domain-containing protein [Armatimonadota bacterium]